MDEEEFIPEVENPKQPDKIIGKIEFDHVWFAYDGENYVLKDVSFVINPGEKVLCRCNRSRKIIYFKSYRQVL